MKRDNIHYVEHCFDPVSHNNIVIQNVRYIPQNNVTGYVVCWTQLSQIPEKNGLSTELFYINLLCVCTYLHCIWTLMVSGDFGCNRYKMFIVNCRFKTGSISRDGLVGYDVAFTWVRWWV